MVNDQRRSFSGDQFDEDQSFPLIPQKLSTTTMGWRLFVRRTSERPPIPKINQNGSGAPVKRAVGKNKYRWLCSARRSQMENFRSTRISNQPSMSNVKGVFLRSLISTLLFLSLILKGPLFFHIDHNSQVSPDDCSTRSSTANAMSSGDCPGTP